MMKQVLLSVPAMLTKVSFGKFAQALRRHFLSRREILLCQHALDPNIDRKCPQPLVRKQHDAVRDFWPHARQRAELSSKLQIRKRRPHLEIRFAGADPPRRRAQVLCAVTARTFPQHRLLSFSNPPRRPHGVNDVIPRPPWFAHPFPKPHRNPATLRPLFTC